MKKIIFGMALCVMVGVLGDGTTAVADTFTDFETFTTGVSVDGQGGWGVAGPPVFDEEVVDFGGNKVWRVSNAVTSGAFGNQPFAPRPGGLPTDTVTDPVNSMPNEFAGESSTGATHNRYYSEFDFRSATGSAQPDLRITLSADNGLGGRQGFAALEDTGTGLAVTTQKYDPILGFLSSTTIATGLSYDDWHTFAIEVLFADGPDNDVINLYVNDSLVDTQNSWEEYYSTFQSSTHPLGVPVQTSLFRISGTAAPGVADGGFFIDNVFTQVSTVPEPSSVFAWLIAMVIVGAMSIILRRPHAKLCRRK